MKQERRAQPVEMRAYGRKLTGHAATFNTEARIGDAWTESIAPGAFAASLASGRDVLALAERGDLGGMSFGFIARDDRRAGDRRELRAVDLLEISVVSAWPAYPDTVVQARWQHVARPALAHAQRLIRLWEVRA